MEEVGRPTPKRRTLLQRGLALVGGALGVGAIGGEVHGRSAGVGVPEHTLQLFGRRRPSTRVAKGGYSESHHVVSTGDLLDGPEGEAVGSFHTNGFCLATTLGPPLPAESNIAFQTFALAEGSLFGLGPGPSVGGERTCAVLGGTGRYAGARGTYVERTPLQGPAGRNTVEFVFTLNA